MERQKNVLLDCLSRQGIALCKLYLYDTNEKEKTTLQEEITVTWRVMLKFIDPNDTKVGRFTWFIFLVKSKVWNFTKKSNKTETVWDLKCVKKLKILSKFCVEKVQI